MEFQYNVHHLCWLASKKNIDVFTLFGNFGVPRFLRFNQKDINLGFDTASKNDPRKA